MSEVVAKRYAEALYELATERKIEEKLISELDTVKEVFDGNKELLDFLNHPRIEFEKKKQLIDEAFQSFDQLILNTLKLLVERHRINQIAAVADHYQTLYNDANGIVHATVYSVRALTDEEKTSLEEAFKKRLNKQSITFSNEVDTSLIGGVKVRIGNTIYDGSISGKLNRLKNRLMAANL